MNMCRFMRKPWRVVALKNKYKTSKTVLCVVEYSRSGEAFHFFAACYATIMNEEIIPKGETPIPGYDQIIHFDTDISVSRKKRSYTEGDLPAEAFDELVEEAERFLSGRELESTDRVSELMNELEMALLVNNDKRVRALQKEFEQTYRKEVVG